MSSLGFEVIDTGNYASKPLREVRDATTEHARKISAQSLPATARAKQKSGRREREQTSECKHRRTKREGKRGREKRTAEKKRRVSGSDGVK